AADHGLIEAVAIRQEDLADKPAIAICVMDENGYRFLEGHARGEMLRDSPKALLFLWSVDAIEADFDGLPLAHHCDGVAIVHANHLTGKTVLDAICTPLGNGVSAFGGTSA